MIKPTVTRAWLLHTRCSKANLFIGRHQTHFSVWQAPANAHPN